MARVPYVRPKEYSKSKVLFYTPYNAIHGIESYMQFQQAFSNAVQINIQYEHFF